MNNSKNNTTPAPTPARTDADKAAAAKDTPLQPPQPENESVLESIGNAISAPVRDAAEDEERKQVGQPPRKP